MRLKRPRQDTMKRVAAFALVIFMMFILISSLDYGRNNARLAKENQEALAEATTQITDLSNQLDERALELSDTRITMEVLIAQNKVLIRQLRQAGIEPLFDERDLGNADAKPNRRQESADSSSRPSPNRRGNTPSTGVSDRGSDPQPNPKPNPPPQPPPPDEPGTPTKPVRDRANDTVDEVEKGLCGILGC